MKLYRNHISVAVWMTVASLLLGQMMHLPPREFTWQVLGSPIVVTFSGAFLAGMIALAITWAGLEAALRTHPQKGSLRHTYRFWGLPSAITLAGAALLPTASTPSLRVLVLIGLAAGLAASMAGEYHTIDASQSAYARARLFLNVLAYTLAALIFVLVYLSRARSLVVASLIGLMAGLLAMDLLRTPGTPSRDIFLHSFFIGLIMAQSAVILNYWAFPSIRVGLILLVGYYLLVELNQWYLRGQLTRRRIGEYLLITGVSFLVILFFPGW